MTTTDLFEKRYRIEEPLGEGGMGEVHRAFDRLTGQRVALKRVTIAKAEDEATRRALVREFQILASLRHPNVITVLDYGFDELGQPYFTMDLLEAAETILEATRARSRLERVRVLVQLLRAIHYLHRRGILHRDLKPSNVLISNGSVKVLDFGLSMAREEATRRAGTLAYMPPEILRGDPATEASDLYSVGVIAYELLAGRPPFRSNDVATLVRAILGAEPDLRPLLGDPRSSDDAGEIDSDTTTMSQTMSTTEALPWEDATPGPPDSPPPTAKDPPESEDPDRQLTAIVGRLIAKSPGSRYPQAAPVIRDLSLAVGEPLPIETEQTRESFLQAAEFVGRGEEFDLLDRALSATLEGRGRGWLIHGESGVGKSRLLSELRTQALVKTALVFRGQAVAEGGAPYHIWREPLRALCLHTPLEDVDARVLKALVPDLGTLIGRRVEDAPELSPEAFEESLISTVVGIIQKQERPTLILLEDIHWAQESMAMLRRVLGALHRVPVMIAASCRAEEAPELAEGLPGLEVLRLQRLGTIEIASLGRSMLGPGGADDRIVSFLDKETEGNAFFLVEVVRALAEEVGQLDEIATMQLPEHVVAGGIQRIVERRLERIPAQSRTFVAQAAILGRELDLAVLGKIFPEGEMERWISECVQALVLEVSENRWRFAHDRLREGMVAALDPDRQRECHRRAATGIELVYGPAPERARALAHHWGAAEDTHQEARYSELAGQYALGRAAYRDAITSLQRAIDLHSLDPGIPIDQPRDTRLLGEAVFGLGDIAGSQAHLERAAGLAGHAMPRTGVTVSFDLARQIGRQCLHRRWPSRYVGRDPAGAEGWLEVSRIYERLGHVHYLLGNTLQSVYSGLRNLNAAERAGMSPELARAYATEVIAAGMVPAHRLAERYAALGRETARHVDNPAARAWVELLIGVYMGGVGRWEEAREALHRATAEYERLGERRRSEEALVTLAFSRQSASDLAESADGWSRLRQIANDIDDTQGRSWALLGETVLALRKGEHAAALTLLQEVDPDRIHTLDAIWFHGMRARARLLEGDLPLAIEAAERGLAHIRKTRPTSFYILEGYAATAEVFLAAMEDEPGKARSGAAKQAVGGLSAFSRVFPIGEPRARLYEGRYRSLLHRHARARQLWKAGLRRAEELHMSYDEGLIHSEFARHLPPESPERDQHLRAAQRAFGEAGAVDPHVLSQGAPD